MKTAAEKIKALRDQLAILEVQGFLVPRGDAYLGEYVPASDERLGWLTGFTGSNGFAVVLEHHAAVITDPRYGIQVKKQCDKRVYTTSDDHQKGLVTWLDKIGVKNIAIGFDPRLHGIASVKHLRAQLEPFGITLTPLEKNPIDQVWFDRPSPPHTGVESFLDSIAGRTVTEKRDLIAASLKEQNVAAAFLSDPTDLAWLLNIRGRDLAYTPVALSRGIIYADGTVEWIIDPLRVPLEIKRAFGNTVTITPPEAIEESIMRLKARAAREPVLVDEKMTNYALAQMMEDRNIVLKLGDSPVIIPRACKTTAEQNALRDAQRRDSAALIKFLAWFSEQAPMGDLDELAVVDKVLFFRKQDPAFRGPSFETIAGFNANGAMMHYKPMPETNLRITGDGLLLLDSGGQYVGGTTDITRVVAVGQPTDEQATHYTTVLKAHIAVARAVFPDRTPGAHLNALSRAPLWAAGMDYGHRLGHGVACYGSVHEPATDLSARGAHDPILEGMYVSNEPGFYREGHYGIRLENLVLVVRADTKPTSFETALTLDTISLVPFDPSLTKMSLLSPEEKDWLAAYHNRILNDIGPMLPPDARGWLETVVEYFV